MSERDEAAASHVVDHEDSGLCPYCGALVLRTRDSAGNRTVLGQYARCGHCDGALRLGSDGLDEAVLLRSPLSSLPVIEPPDGEVSPSPGPELVWTGTTDVRVEKADLRERTITCGSWTLVRKRLLATRMDEVTLDYKAKRLFTMDDAGEEIHEQLNQLLSVLHRAQVEFEE